MGIGITPGGNTEPTLWQVGSIMRGLANGLPRKAAVLRLLPIAPLFGSLMPPPKSAIDTWYDN